MMTNTQPAILSRELCGEFSRFCITSLHTRFGAVEWHVTDAEQIDPVCDMPAIVYQGNEAGARAYVTARTVER